MYLTLFVLFCLAVCRAADLARPWDIELTKGPSEEPNTCQNWRDVVQRAYDEVETLVDAALRDLKIVREKRPDWATDNDGRKKYENWNRIDRNLQTFFGFSMDPEEPDADSEYMKNILGTCNHVILLPGISDFVSEVLEPMSKTLKEGSEPELHYKVQFERAAIACSDEGWRYVAPGDIDPNDLEARSLRDVPGREKFKDTGAWVWKSRYLWIKDRTTTEKVNLCRPGVQAVVAHAADLLTLCLRAEDEFGEPLRVTIDRELVTKRRSLDEIMDYGGLVSTTLLHELSHLFGAWGDPTVDDWLEGATEHRVGKPESETYSGQQT